jgi:hypothetical protein
MYNSVCQNMKFLTCSSGTRWASCNGQLQSQLCLKTQFRKAWSPTNTVLSVTVIYLFFCNSNKVKFMWRSRMLESGIQTNLTRVAMSKSFRFQTCCRLCTLLFFFIIKNQPTAQIIVWFLYQSVLLPRHVSVYSPASRMYTAYRYIEHRNITMWCRYWR